MEKYIYNPINNKSPGGASVVGTTITYSLKVSKFEHIGQAYFVMHQDGVGNTRYPMNVEYVDERYIHYSYSHTYNEVGFYWYHFEMDRGEDTIFLHRTDTLDAREGEVNNDYLQLIIASESDVDPTFRKGIIYHIFVDRFYKSGDVKPRAGLNLVDWDSPIVLEYNSIGERVNNNCYGGNIRGIIDKLKYLKGLNVGTIYLSPVFEANSNHKYNVADYSKIDSMLGTTEDFQELITKAKRMGIRVIVDGVFNHTGSDSIYFNKYGRYKTVGAYQSPNSKYYNWYEFYNYPQDYSCWWGVLDLPQTREDSGFYDYISGKNGIIDKYMSMGLGGFRLDVVDELTNDFLHSICTAIKRTYPHALVVGEVWEDASCKISYDERKNYFLGGNLDSVTNYPMKNAILDYVKYGNVDAFVSTIRLIQDQYPKGVQKNLMNILDTHDTKRAITFLGADVNNIEYSESGNYTMGEEEYSRGVQLLKLATIMQYTVMGVPTVFYGDEAGLQGMKDPYCRKPFPWGHEDQDLMEWYVKLGALRNNQVFDGGDLKIIYASGGVIIYERVKGDDKVIIAINRSGEDFTFTLERACLDYLTGDRVSGKISLAPDTAKVFI